MSLSDKRSGEEVAIKLIKRPLPKIILPNILREIRIQAELGEGHVNIVDAKAALLTESHLALVMEYAAGGSLTGYVAERWQHAQHAGLFLGEDEARYFFRQFIGAVEYCHSHCVAHRDLKLDNTLLSSDSPPVLKLCDFGFAKTWTEDANMYTHIGENERKERCLTGEGEMASRLSLFQPGPRPVRQEAAASCFLLPCALGHARPLCGVAGGRFTAPATRRCVSLTRLPVGAR